MNYPDYLSAPCCPHCGEAALADDGEFYYCQRGHKWAVRRSLGFCRTAPMPPSTISEEAQRTADAVNRHAPRRFRPRTQTELDQERNRARLAERLAAGESVPMGLFF